MTKERAEMCWGNRAGVVQTAVLRIVRTPKAEALLGNYKFLSSHELPCCILKNRLLTSGESTNSAFRAANVTAKRVLMDVEKRALTNG